MSLEVHIEKKLNGFTLRSDFAAGNTATAILGASGCGKSMTLRCIAGIVKPDKGRILLDGRVLFDSEQHIDLPPQQRNVGLLFQNYALYPHMTVYENMAFGLKLRHVDPQEIDRKVKEAAEILDITQYLDRKPKALSGGQRQRVLLARALCQQPELIVLDEPTSYLDIRYKLELLTILKRMVREEDLAVLMSLHELDLARRVSDTVVCVAGDHIDRVGPPEEIFTRDYIAKLYHMEPGRYDPCFSTLDLVP